MLSDYGLIKDPFTIVPDGPVENWAGHEEMRDELIDFMLGVRASDIGSTEFLVLHGELGAGKSHALRYLKTKIEQRDSEYRSLAIYVERPRVAAKLNFLELYRYIIAELGRETIEDICKKVDDTLTNVIRQLAQDAGYEDTTDLGSFAQRAFDSLRPNDRNMVRLLGRGASEFGPVFDFMSGKANCTNSEYEGKINSDFMASKVLGDFFRVISSDIGAQQHIFESVYLFVDECEILFDAKATESDPVFSGFRELINGVPYGLGLILSFSAATALIEAYMPQHLLKRMTHEFIEIPMLEDDQARDFLKDQLNSFRPNGSKHIGTLYPFSEEAIAYVVENQTSLTPRNMFMNCRRILERSIRRYGLEVDEEISRDMAERILHYR